MLPGTKKILKNFANLETFWKKYLSEQKLQIFWQENNQNVFHRGEQICAVDGANLSKYYIFWLTITASHFDVWLKIPNDS